MKFALFFIYMYKKGNSIGLLFFFSEDWEMRKMEDVFSCAYHEKKKLLCVGYLYNFSPQEKKKKMFLCRIIYFKICTGIFFFFVYILWIFFKAVFIKVFISLFCVICEKGFFFPGYQRCQSCVFFFFFQYSSLLIVSWILKKCLVFI